jgi:hypothetical protein
MADTSSSNDPRGHCNAVAVRIRGRGRGGAAGERPGRARQGQGPKPRAPGCGNSAVVGSGRGAVNANSDQGDDSRRGGHGRRGSESGLGRSTASVRGFPQRRGRATKMRGERN